MVCDVTIHFHDEVYAKFVYLIIFVKLKRDFCSPKICGGQTQLFPPALSDLDRLNNNITSAHLPGLGRAGRPNNRGPPLPMAWLS